jgi:hypothetical protein
VTAEIGQLRRLAVGDLWNRAGFGHQAGVGGLHSIHIGPDDRFTGIEGCPEDRGGIVRATPTERGLLAVHGRTDKASDYRYDTAIEQRPKNLGSLFARRLHQGFGAPVMRVGDDHFGGGDRHGTHVQLAESPGQKGRREAFADAGNHVQHAGRQLVE